MKRRKTVDMERYALRLTNNPAQSDMGLLREVTAGRKRSYTMWKKC